MREELTLGALVKKFYSEHLDQEHGYKANIIKHIKDSLRVWLFEETKGAACKTVITYSIKDLQISKFTNQKMRQVHSPINNVF